MWPVKIVAHNNGGEAFACQGPMLSFKIGFPQFNALAAFEILDPAQISVNRDHRKAPGCEKSSMTTGTAGKVEYPASLRDQF